MSEKASKKAEDFLENLGVNIWKNTRVLNYDGKIVTTDTDISFETATLVWADGVKGEVRKGMDDAALLSKSKRLLVNEFNQVIGFENIFAIGDVASMVTEEFQAGHPMMAQPAIQQGKQLGDNLLRLMENKAMKPFAYKDKGAMATVGRNKAVVDLKNFKFQGIFAWFVWRSEEHTSELQSRENLVCRLL